MQRGIAENAMCSKWAGGLGGSWTAVRGTGAHIEGTNGESQGVIPFLKLHNDQLVAVNQGGKRAGSGCAYLEIWHNDIRDFLELRRNTGDERRRTHDMNTACWIPDLFMKRVEARETLDALPQLRRARPARAVRPRLRGALPRATSSSRRAGRRSAGEKIEALELWKKMLKMLFETGHPWITFKDPCNVRCPQDHVGVIHSSNLCTEITLNTSADETAVCNLGSIVLDEHLTADGEIDHEKLRETVRVAVRALDNVIDINFYPTEAARTSNLRHRPIGLGVMGLAVRALPQGARLRLGRGGRVRRRADGGDRLLRLRGLQRPRRRARPLLRATPARSGTAACCRRTPSTCSSRSAACPSRCRAAAGSTGRPLRAKIAAQGMRNSNVLAIAPTATISNIMGTSPCIEPLYKNLFAKSNLSGEFVVLNPYLVRDLKAARPLEPRARRPDQVLRRRARARSRRSRPS